MKAIVFASTKGSETQFRSVPIGKLVLVCRDEIGTVTHNVELSRTSTMELHSFLLETLGDKEKD